MLTSKTVDLVYTVDLGSLPPRPAMVVEVAPDAAHPDMQLEVEISSCTLFDASGFCPPLLPQQPDPTTGAKRVVYEPFLCEVRSEYLGETCEVRVRAVEFGAAGRPATVDVTIRGETRPPTGTEEISVDPARQSVTIPATKDTTLYQANTSSGNGAGESFWSAASTGTNARHGLVDFSIASYVPQNVQIVDAALQLSILSATAGASFGVYAVPDSSAEWIEGSLNAAGDESVPPSPGVGPHASWLHRSFNALFLPLGPWSTPGGDRGPIPVMTVAVSGAGLQSFGSPELVDLVAQVHGGQVAEDGLLFVPVAGAVRFGSRESASFIDRPGLYVEHSAPPTQEQLDTGTMNYFNEAQNFRWIYDLDADNVVFTEIGGRCEALNPNTGGPNHAITYQYLGDPSDSGLDCCSWQIGSTTGVTGAGQALFYVNLDASDPANQPGDADLDGMKDLCDNCPSRANGPLRGSCIHGPRTTQPCRSNQDCLGYACSLAQDDADRDGTGDACVPEPGLGAMIGAGGLGAFGLAAMRRHHRATRPPRSSRLARR